MSFVVCRGKRHIYEEYFRFKKQQFDFEDIRVRSLNSIRAMNLLLSIVIGFVAMLSEKRKEVLWVSKIAKRIYDIPKFNYYALSDDIYAILQKSKTGIESFIKPRLKMKQSQQLMIADVLMCLV